MKHYIARFVRRYLGYFKANINVRKGDDCDGLLLLCYAIDKYFLGVVPLYFLKVLIK